MVTFESVLSNKPAALCNFRLYTIAACNMIEPQLLPTLVATLEAGEILLAAAAENAQQKHK
jgi:hypothetical protein